jgi:GNAT superfamily N-acetyltransferase
MAVMESVLRDAPEPDLARTIDRVDADRLAAFVAFERRNGADMPIGRLFQRELCPTDPALRLIMVSRAGAVLASGILRDASVLGREETEGILNVTVDALHRGRGLGQELLSVFEAEALERGHRRIWSVAYADAADGLDFAQRHGYEEAIRKTRWTLELAKFDPTRFRGTAAAQGSVEYDTLADLRADGLLTDELMADMLSAHHEVLVELGSSLEPRFRALPGYRRFLESDPIIADATVVARRRGRVVGLAVISAAEPRWAVAHVIGSLGRARGRPVTLAMKIRAIEALRTRGVERFSLLWDGDNTPTRLINPLMGFRPERTLVVFSKRLR